MQGNNVLEIPDKNARLFKWKSLDLTVSYIFFSAPRLNLFILLTLASLLLAPLAALHAADAPASPPNIVFLLADDLGYMDVGANNSRTF